MSARMVMLIVLCLVATLTGVYLSGPGPRDAKELQDAHVGAAELITLAQEGKLERATIESGKIEAIGTGFHYTAYTGEPWIVTKAFREHGVTYREVKRTVTAGDILLETLPWFLLLLFVFFLLRSIAKRQGSSGPFAFGQHKAVEVSNPDKRFTDVAGIDEAIDDMKEVVDFLKNPRKYLSVGAKIPKGILLMGPPGCGKTALAKAVAGEAGVPFFSVSGSAFIEMFVGVGASRIRDLFETARKRAPCIVFIDEIDALGKKRSGTTFGGGHDERDQTLNQLLVEMDGFTPSEGVIVMAATNQPEVLDEALLRPGRFDRRISVPRPDLRGRAGILAIHLRGKAVDPDVDLGNVARGTLGMTGADLESLVNEAVLIMAKADRQLLSHDDLMRARDRVVMGPERKSLRLSLQDRIATAYHEGGHALLGHLTPHADPVHRVSIVPRSTALGVTWSAAEEDVYSLSEDHLLARIRMAMGGRAAEEIVYGKGGITTGASNDLEQATATATVMVEKFGMSEVGLRSFGGNPNAEIFGDGRRCSEQTAHLIDEAIEEKLRTQYEEAKTLLSRHRDMLEAIKDLLIQKETIDQADLIAIAGPKAVPATPAIA